MKMSMHKFMRSLDAHVYSELRLVANEKGVGMQELIKAIVVAERMRSHNWTLSRQVANL